MNSGKEHNPFIGIPGFEASKGERITKALQKLWQKIEALEQIKISEKKSRSQEPSTFDEDLTITDVQYKLLVLQLQYARSILKKNNDVKCKIYHRNQTAGEQRHGHHDLKQKKFCSNSDNEFVSQETQTGNSFVEESNKCFNAQIHDASRDVEGTISQVSSNVELPKCKNQTEYAATSSFKRSSKPHYHLKLDDVPFILGASSSASHSVVANVQNIIAMMKSHNKALCGPKHNASKAVVHLNPSGGDMEDTTKMLNDLTEELCELALKQKKLAKSIDAAQEKNQDTNCSKNFQGIDKANKNCNLKYCAEPSMKKLRSNSESEIKMHAEVKNFPKRKENDLVKNYVQPKHSVSNVRNQSSNLSIMHRRKLLKSLQNFKSHLSEEDISWD